MTVGAIGDEFDARHVKFYTLINTLVFDNLDNEDKLSSIDHELTELRKLMIDHFSVTEPVKKPVAKKATTTARKVTK